MRILSNEIGRQALGSTAFLGELYDARTDQFLATTILKNGVPSECIRTREIPYSDIQLIQNDEFGEKFSKMSLRPELQVSVLAGLVSLDGSGRYLKDQKNSARIVKSSLIYKIKTKVEELNIHHEKLKNSFSLDAIKNGTHVVTGITWGATYVLSCQYKNKEGRDKKVIEAEIAAALNRILLSVRGQEDVDDNFNDLNFEIKFFGDILPNKLPTTLQDGMNLIKNQPTLLQNFNNGMGKPIKYKLVPINLVKNYLKLPVNTIISRLDDAILIRIVQVFDEINATKQNVNDVFEDAMEFPVCVSKTDRARIISIRQEFLLMERKFKADVAETIVKVRSGTSEMTEMESLLISLRSGNHSPRKIEMELESWKDICNKIVFAREIDSLGGKYIGVDCELDQELVKNFDAKSFVLYFTKDYLKEPIIWGKNRQIFYQKLRDNDTGAYFVVDCDFHPDLAPQSKQSCVKVFQRSEVISADLLAEQELMKTSPVATVQSGTVQTKNKPANRVPFVISCTGKNCDPLPEYEWLCLRCHTELEWGFDDHVYCNCGKTPVTSLEFKCTDVNHSNFEKHSPAYLQELVSRIKPFDEVNILLLGETGVGKSTFINVFQNFMQFKTLDEALAHKNLVSSIVTEFTMMDESFNQVVVSTGKDQNEIHGPGQSTTQSARIYQFQAGRASVRFIDTPGIGDSRGVGQDKENFKNTLNTIAQLDSLHGICILLKPNNSRLTSVFRFCINELLTHLHRGASKNIVFCFTNTRGSLYKPGDTLPLLRAILNENKDVRITLSRQTVYCFDSESFRFLAAVKNTPPVTFDDDEKRNYQVSWENSLKETKRLLQHITALPAHSVKSTVDLNATREMTLKLARPLAEILRVININKAIVEEEVNNIENMEETLKTFRKTVMVTRMEIEVERLDYPRVVCSHPTCVSYRTAVGTRQRFEEFTQICHARCDCYEGGVNTKGDPDLMECVAMQPRKTHCEQCGHSYREHVRIIYSSKPVIKQVEDESVKAVIKQRTSAIETKRLILEAKKNSIRECEEERKEVQGASASFACFLKNNAITPYNDETERYLKLEIENEMDRVQMGKDRIILTRLEESLRSYLEEKRILEVTLCNGNAHTITKVKESFEKLKELKHFGKSLADALICIDRMGICDQSSKSDIVNVSSLLKQKSKKWWQFWK